MESVLAGDTLRGCSVLISLLPALQDLLWSGTRQFYTFMTVTTAPARKIRKIAKSKTPAIHRKRAGHVGWLYAMRTAVPAIGLSQQITLINRSTQAQRPAPREIVHLLPRGGQQHPSGPEMESCYTFPKKFEVTWISE